MDERQRPSRRYDDEDGNMQKDRSIYGDIKKEALTSEEAKKDTLKQVMAGSTISRRELSSTRL